MPPTFGASKQLSTTAGRGVDPPPPKSTGHSGRQKVAVRRNMRREERVTVQGPVKEQQPDGVSHRGWTSPPTPSLLRRGQSANTVGEDISATRSPQMAQSAEDVTATHYRQVTHW